MDTSGDSPQVPIPWEALRAWLRDAESTQIKTGSTDHISPARRLALSRLVSFIQESHMASGDYVSKIHQFAQQKHLDMPRFTTEPLTVPVAGIFTTRWKSTCLLPWSGRRFPDSGKDDIALFTNAKEAKQFAAMKAFAHVASFSTQEFSSSARPSSLRGHDAANRHGAEHQGEIAILDCEISILAARLGISEPEYSVKQDLDRPNCFAALAEFGGGDAPRGPKEPLLVSGVLGRAQAREAIGRIVLQWMEGESKRGSDMLNSILAARAMLHYEEQPVLVSEKAEQRNGLPYSGVLLLKEQIVELHSCPSFA